MLDTERAKRIKNLLRDVNRGGVRDRRVLTALSERWFRE
jgi:hypothetical protein